MDHYLEVVDIWHPPFIHNVCPFKLLYWSSCFLSESSTAMPVVCKKNFIEKVLIVFSFALYPCLINVCPKVWYCWKSHLQMSPIQTNCHWCVVLKFYYRTKIGVWSFGPFVSNYMQLFKTWCLWKIFILPCPHKEAKQECAKPGHLTTLFSKGFRP